MIVSQGQFRRFVVIVLMLLSLMAFLPSIAAAQGNSEAARACQDGGYANLVGAGGETFANTGECVRFAANGGVFADGTDVLEGAIVVPAGYSVSYSSTLSACNALVFGYSASDGTGAILDSIAAGECWSSGPSSASGTIGPFMSDVVFTVYLTDETCGVTFDSNDTISGHVVVTETAPTYQVDIADGGYYCERTGTISGFALPGNLSVTLQVHP